MPREIGIDAVPIEISFTKDNGEERKFTTIAGVAITSDNSDALKHTFEEILRESLLEIGIKTERKILCSYDLMQLTSGEFKILDVIYEKLKGNLDRMDIFYHAFNSKRIPLVKIFGRIGGRTLTFDDFRKNHLENSFPHLCMWRIFNDIQKNQATVYSDNFFTYTTEAWETIRTYPNIHILPNGDKVNHLIAIADLILKVLEMKLFIYKKSLYIPHIKEVMGNDIFERGSKVFLFSNKYLPFITPLDKTGINMKNHIKHPIYFVMKQRDSTIDLDFILSHLPKLANEVYESQGSIKFFKEKADRDLIQRGDVFIYFDKYGESDINVIKGLGLDIVSQNVKNYAK